MTVSEIVEAFKEQGYADATTLSESGMRMARNLAPSHLILEDDGGVYWLARCVRLDSVSHFPEFIVFGLVEIKGSPRRSGGCAAT